MAAIRQLASSLVPVVSVEKCARTAGKARGLCLGASPLLSSIPGTVHLLGALGICITLDRGGLPLAWSSCQFRGIARRPGPLQAVREGCCAAPIRAERGERIRVRGC